MRTRINIKYYRKEKFLSVTELAERAHLSESYLSEIEAGKKIPSVEALDSIAKGLGICIRVLLECEIPCDKCSRKFKCSIIK